MRTSQLKVVNGWWCVNFISLVDMWLETPFAASYTFSRVVYELSSIDANRGVVFVEV